VGDGRDRTALLVDDFAASGGTLADAAERLAEGGAIAVYAVVTISSLFPFDRQQG
jgi:phosphoribosylpyrophosphate synthetase